MTGDRFSVPDFFGITRERAEAIWKELVNQASISRDASLTNNMLGYATKNYMKQELLFAIFILGCEQGHCEVLSSLGVPY